MSKLTVITHPITGNRTTAILLRGGPIDGQTGEHLGSLPQHLDVKLGRYGTWRYLRSAELAMVTDFVPGSITQRTREGVVYVWNERDPDGNRI